MMKLPILPCAEKLESTYTYILYSTYQYYNEMSEWVTFVLGGFCPEGWLSEGTLSRRGRYPGANVRLPTMKHPTSIVWTEGPDVHWPSY